MKSPLPNGNSTSLSSAILPKAVEFPPGISYSNQMCVVENMEASVMTGSNQFFIEGKAPKIMQVQRSEKKSPPRFACDKSLDPFTQSQAIVIAGQKPPAAANAKGKVNYSTFEFRMCDDKSDAARNRSPGAYHTKESPFKERLGTRDKSPNSSSHRQTMSNAKGVLLPPKNLHNGGWVSDSVNVIAKKLPDRPAKPEVPKHDPKPATSNSSKEEQLEAIDYLLDDSATHFNSFNLPVSGNSKESTKEQEIEEIMEVDEKQSEVNVYEDAFAPVATPLMSMVQEKSCFGRTLKEPCARETCKRELEDSKVISEEEEIEMLGANNPSLLDYASRLRPFSPPFAHMKSDSKPKNKGAASKKGEAKTNTKKGKHEKAVVYDPILKYYYDPRNGEYYHAN
eukprot:TRINITY_DN8970_c0_g2_i1.p1 TRINITY_DN8970_c0_g2~~TRINITY_DN8970_c0_g2_i1.p1  ORF type:complete len:395 (-),score=98.52 TRINITY_DN8970_c0_g2_i1:981-2165(-)